MIIMEKDIQLLFKKKKNNPRLQVNSLDEYVDVMNNLKLVKPSKMDSNIASNVKGLTL